MKKVVLLIDDDIDDHEFFISAVADYDNDINVASAFDGFDAFNQLKLIKPEWIFLDINMPKLNGLEVLKRLKTEEDYKRIPIYIYTTSDGYNSESVAMQLGAEKYYTKPSSPEKLKAIFEEVLVKKIN